MDDNKKPDLDQPEGSLREGGQLVQNLFENRKEDPVVGMWEARVC